MRCPTRPSGRRTVRVGPENPLGRPGSCRTRGLVLDWVAGRSRMCRPLPSTVSVAQSVEHWIVAPEVVGSIPITHPTPSFQIEKIAKDRDASANRLVVELVMESLERRGWPRAEPDIQVAKAALCAAQILRRDPIAAGRKDDVEETLQFVSALVSNSAVNSSPPRDPLPS